MGWTLFRGIFMPTAGNFKVTQEDFDRIKEFSTRSGRPLADIYRSAVLEYIDREQHAEDDAYFIRRMKDRDKLIVEGLKSIENRFATLIVRLGIDLESLYALAWSLTAEQPDREEMFEKCYQVGVKRFRRKLKGLEKDMVDSLIHSDELISVQRKAAQDDNEDDEE